MSSKRKIGGKGKKLLLSADDIYVALAKKINEADECATRTTTFWNDGQAYAVVEERVGVSLLYQGEASSQVIWIPTEHLGIVREAIDRVLAMESPGLGVTLKNEGPEL